MEKKRRMVTKDGSRVFYSYSNKTLAYCHFFRMLFLRSMDSKQDMQMLLNLNQEHEYRIKMWSEKTKRKKNDSTTSIPVSSPEEARKKHGGNQEYV